MDLIPDFEVEQLLKHGRGRANHTHEGNQDKQKIPEAYCKPIGVFILGASIGIRYYRGYRKRKMDFMI